MNREDLKELTKEEERDIKYMKALMEAIKLTNKIKTQ
jgi:hypothetical protein